MYFYRKIFTYRNGEPAPPKIQKLLKLNWIRKAIEKSDKMTCDIIKKFNSKMNEVLENKEALKEKIEVNLDCLSELFFPELKKVYDCIIISSENLDELEANFESSIEFLGGKNFYEVSE